jgi:hypothetical protein
MPVIAGKTIWWNCAGSMKKGERPAAPHITPVHHAISAKRCAAAATSAGAGPASGRRWRR